MIRWLGLELVSLLLKINDVHEGDILVSDANIVQQSSGGSEGVLIQVGQHSILELSSLTVVFVIGDVLSDLVNHGRAVSKDILHLADVDWHAALFSIYHLLLV